jgi:hypothetical protein
MDKKSFHNGLWQAADSTLNMRHDDTEDGAPAKKTAARRPTTPPIRERRWFCRFGKSRELSAQ